MRFSPKAATYKKYSEGDHCNIGGTCAASARHNGRGSEALVMHATLISQERRRRNARCLCNMSRKTQR